MDEYLYKMDIVDITNASQVAGIPEQLIERIWEKTRTFGEIW